VQETNGFTIAQIKFRK